MALISLGSLAAAIFLGFFRKMNTGLVCIGFALLLGKLAGIPDKEIIGGFNYSLFLMLLGVTYLFGLAEWNGTLKLLTKKITVLAGKGHISSLSSCTSSPQYCPRWGRVRFPPPRL